MLQLAEILQQRGIRQTDLAKAAGIGVSALNRLIRHGEYPRSDYPGVTRLAVRKGLALLGVTTGLETCFREVKKATAACNGVEPGTPPSGEATTLEVQMLIRKQRLSNAARQAFNLSSAALEAPTRPDQVFLGGEMRVGYEHLLTKAKFGGVLALAGESGAGKTTLKDLLVTQLAQAGEVLVIEPHTQAMEASDKVGKTLKAAHIAEAILREVAPMERPKASSEARLNQVESALAKSADENEKRRHLLVIDEAHCLPIATLKHLKRFFEFKRKGRGLQPALLTIILLGQPEIVKRLSTYDMEVREVWQRCELVRLPPLDKELSAYLKFRLGAAAEAFDADALDALRLVLTTADGARSYLYPLAIDNWSAAILNLAADIGARRITAELVEEVRKELLRNLLGVD